MNSTNDTQYYFMKSSVVSRPFGCFLPSTNCELLFYSCSGSSLGLHSELLEAEC